MATKTKKAGKLPTGVVRKGKKFRIWVMWEGSRRYPAGVYDTAAQAAVAREEFTRLDSKQGGRRRVTLQMGFDWVMDRGGLRPATAAYYREKFDYLTRVIDADTSIKAIGEPTILRYVKKREDAGLSPASVRKELVMLSRILKVCVEDDLLDVNPVPRFVSKFKTRLKSRKKIPRYVSRTEYGEVRDRMKEWIPKRDRDDQIPDVTLELFVPKLLFFTGLRRSELGRLRVGDIDLAASTIAVDGKTSDSGVPIPKVLRGDVAAFIEARDLKPGELLVGDERDIDNVLRRWRQRLKIEWTPHALRHGYGTMLAEKGADTKTIMRMMRHETPEMALHYQHVTDTRVQDFADSLS